mgnify:CR=1 FL=1
MGLLDIMANIANHIPTVEKPVRRPGLYERLLWTFLALLAYIIMANTPLYGIATTGGGPRLLLVEIIFASTRGTLMELGIGPIVTAGLIMQILVGAKLIDLDLSNPEDRRKFTAAQKTFALALAAFEAIMYAAACRYWTITGPNPFFYCSASLLQRALVALQLFIATYIVILLDEMIQKGWGIGSGVSLFILAGVAQRMLWNLLSPITVGGEPIGFIPHLVTALSTGRLDTIIMRPTGRGDLVGLIVTIAIIFILVYLQGMRVEIPVTSPRLRSIKTKIPLQFLYVANIPVLLVGILYSDILVFASLLRTYLGAGGIADMLATYRDGALVGGLAYYLSPPGGLIQTIADPVKALVYAISVIGLAILFGLMWVEVAGLNAAAQAEQLVKSGLEIPGIRRNPKILERLLSKYITPLTILSSMIVALVAVVADLLGAYGTGMGILLAVGIVQQYYSMIAYERSLEAYPALKRLIGE